MPLFITYASYSHSGVKGLVNKPEDRSGAVKALIEKAGGTLVALYNTNGPSGALSRVETVRAWTKNRPNRSRNCYGASSSKDRSWP